MRAVLWAAAIRAAFLLLFGLMAFVSFVFVRGRGSFVSVYLVMGTALLPLLVPAFVFMTTRHPSQGGQGSSTAVAMLAAGLALLVILVPVPGTPPTALAYVSPRIEQALSTAGFVVARLTSRPLQGMKRLIDACQSPDDCHGKQPSYQCANVGFRNVCVATTRPLSTGCPQGWSCVVTMHNEDPVGDTEESDCVPASKASSFEAAFDCKGWDGPAKPLFKVGAHNEEE